MRCWGAVGCWCVTFFALLGLLVAETVQSSPCWRKMGRNRRFGACQASFVPGWPPSRARWESFVPGGPAKAARWESFVPGGSPSRAAGRVLYRVGRRAGRQGEFCTGWACQGRLLGEFCTGWAAEPGSRASFVSLKARCGLHRAFLAPIAPPIDAAVMRCRYAWARWPCPTGQREPHPGSVGYAFVAPRKPPAHASCAGGRQRKHQQATQAVQTT